MPEVPVSASDHPVTWKFDTDTRTRRVEKIVAEAAEGRRAAG